MGFNTTMLNVDSHQFDTPYNLDDGTAIPPIGDDDDDDHHHHHHHHHDASFWMIRGILGFFSQTPAACWSTDEAHERSLGQVDRLVARCQMTEPTEGLAVAWNAHLPRLYLEVSSPGLYRYTPSITRLF